MSSDEFVFVDCPCAPGTWSLGKLGETKMSGVGPALEAHVAGLSGLERLVVVQYGQEVCAMAPKIDEGDEYCWQSLWIGFALAKGLGIGRATEYRFYMDYVFPMESMSAEDLLGPLSDQYRRYLLSPVDPRD